MNEKSASREIISTTERSVDAFTSSSSSVQRQIMQNINRYIRQIEVDALGNIKPTSDNLRIIRQLRREIESLVITPEYMKKVDYYLNTFSEVKGITDGLYNNIERFKPNKLIFKDTLALNIDITKESLTRAGINQNVTQPILDIIQKGITSGANINDMEDDLRLHILGDDERLGGLERYTKQITRDALNQYSANYSEAISMDLGLEWYYYSGSIIEDSRSYCIERAGKYFHKKEVEDVPSKWPGMIPGTNSSMIFINRGGYNCRHLYLTVLIDVVPKSVINRNITNGNYSPPES